MLCRTVRLFCVLAIAMSFSTQSRAGVITVNDVQAYNATTLLGSATAARGPISGNDNAVTDAILDSYFELAASFGPSIGTPLGDVTWSKIGSSDDGLNGPFTSNPEVIMGELFFDSFIASNTPFVIFLKGGNNFAAYAFSGFGSNVTSVKFDTQALPTGGPNPAELSHATLWTGSTGGTVGPAVAPEPASAILFLLLGAAGLVRSRFRGNVA